MYTTVARAGDMTPKKIILDVDTGVDDAHAIMLALSQANVDVLAITCANGNVKIDDVIANTLRVLNACDKLDVPVYKGAARSLLGQVSTCFNSDAAAWRTPVDLSGLQPDHAANALVNLAKQHPGEITLVALAPLTNVALAVNIDPAFPKNLRDVVIMGGNTNARGRVSPCAEFNFHGDPEAAHIALNSLENIRLLPYEVCVNHLLSWYFMQKWTSQSNKKSHFLRDSLGFLVTDAKSSGHQGYRTCDGFAMAAALDEQVVTKSQSIYATVELNGQLTRGQMVVDWTGLLAKKANMSLIQGLDMKRIEEILYGIVK